MQNKILFIHFYICLKVSNVHRSDKCQIQCSGYYFWVYIVGNGIKEMYTESFNYIYND